MVRILEFIPSEREVIRKFCTEEGHVLILQDYSGFCVENNLQGVEQKQENHLGAMAEPTYFPPKFSLSFHILAWHNAAQKKDYISQAPLQLSVAM